MAWIFGDSFDLYTTSADAVAGYWDSGLGTGFVAGRFAGSQAVGLSGTAVNYVKSSGANDAVHHIVCAYQQTAALSGTSLGAYLQLSDGASAQCSIVFRSDGAILLTSGGPTGTTLATYTGAVTLASTWYAFEFEVVINNTTGSFTVRKNGNTSNDFTLGSLNTRGGTTNNYANKLTLGMNVGINAQIFDDLLWRSDATSGSGLATWVGDIRCYARMPASDASTQFSRFPASRTTSFNGTASTPSISINANTVFFVPVTSPTTGLVFSVFVNLFASYAGNFNMALYADSSGTPGALLASANQVVAPGSGIVTCTFTTPPSVTIGTKYWIAYNGSSGSSSPLGDSTVPAGGMYSMAQTYGTFPSSGASATSLASHAGGNYVGMNASLTGFQCVGEAQEDAGATYVYDSTPGHADFYGIASIPVTPVNTVAVTTRGFMEKSDAGSRSGAVQLKSGGTTVASPATALNTTWGWTWRTDTTDPATSAAWTATGVNNAQVGPTVVA